MRNNATGSVRMGPITLISFVIILCLAVLSVLAVTTAMATDTEADRQVQSSNARYALEMQAQEYLADADAWLADNAGAGISGTVAELSQWADGDITGDDSFTAVFTESGRTLTVGLRITPDMHYEITQWTISSDWSTRDEETLWTGN